MICPPCKFAGRELSMGNPRVAEVYHRVCAQNRTDETGQIITHVEPTQCDCQHSLQSVISTVSDR